MLRVSLERNRMISVRSLFTITTLCVVALSAIDVRVKPVYFAGDILLAHLEDPGDHTPAQPATLASVMVNQKLVMASSESCPSNMVEISGYYCPDPVVICDEYISEQHDRCERFRPNSRCLGKPKPKLFCIDRFEFPNEAGKRPTVDITWYDARSQCANLGKRLCDAEEWTLACEGPQLKPYPFGYVRDATICNFDRPYVIPDNVALDNPKTRAAEIARINQSEPSGSRARCVSDYGVYDMTGNVDEWVFDVRGSPQGPEFQSGLKGGYWGPVRNRCRPMTTDHNQWHHGYQIGFRCCNDIQSTSPASSLGAESVEVLQSTDDGSNRAGEPVQVEVPKVTNDGSNSASEPVQVEVKAKPRVRVFRAAARARRRQTPPLAIAQQGDALVVEPPSPPAPAEQVEAPAEPKPPAPIVAPKAPDSVL